MDNVRAKLEFAICLGSRFAAPPWARNSRWSVSRHLRCFGLAPLTLEGHRRPGSHLGTSDSTDGMATTCDRVFATSATTALLVAPGPSGSPSVVPLPFHERVVVHVVMVALGRPVCVSPIGDRYGA